jgi:hypothetical protein
MLGNALDEISLANYSQFLLVTTGSLEHLAREMIERKGIHFSEEEEVRRWTMNHQNHEPLTERQKQIKEVSSQELNVILFMGHSL